MSQVKSPAHDRVRMVPFAGVLAVTMALAVIVFPTFGALSAFLIDDLSLSRTQFGWLPSAAAFATAAFALVGGRLSDNWGGRAAIVRLLSVTAVMAIGLAVSPSYPVLLTFALLAGVPNAMANPATNKMIADHLPVGARGVTMGVKQSGVQAGMFVAGLALPLIAVWGGWRMAFGLIALTAVSAGVFARRLLPEDPVGSSVRGDSKRYRMGRDQRWLGLYALCMGTGGAAVTAFMALYAVERLAFAPAPAGATVAVVGFMGVVSRIAIGRLVERRAMSFPLTLATLSFGAAATIGMVLAAPHVGPWLLWVGAATAGTTVMAWNAVANLAAVSSVPRREAGRASAVVNLGFMSGLAMGPMVFGAVVDRTASYNPAWTISLLCFVAAGAVTLVWALADRRALPRAHLPST